MSRRRRWGCGCAVFFLGAVISCCGGSALIVGVPGAVIGASEARERQERHAAAPDGRFVTVDDAEIFLIERGPTDGPVMIFVHGSAAWSGTWGPTLDALAAQGIHAVAIDLPPFGYSSRPVDVSRPAQARRILGVADALGVQHFTLVGHSFGAGPTVEAAMLANADHRLERLILLAGALGIDQPDASMGIMALRPLRQLFVASTFTQPAFIPTGLRQFVHDDTVVTPEVVARYTRPLDVKGTTTAVTDWLPELLAPGPSPSLSHEAYLTLTVPTLLVWGAGDTTTPVAQAEALHAWLPDATLVVLPKVGHLPHIESPEAVQALLLPP